jgi:hypothetical protein
MENVEAKLGEYRMCYDVTCAKMLDRFILMKPDVAYSQ